MLGKANRLSPFSSQDGSCELLQSPLLAQQSPIAYMNMCVCLPCCCTYFEPTTNAISPPKPSLALKTLRKTCAWASRSTQRQAHTKSCHAPLSLHDQSRIMPSPSKPIVALFLPALATLRSGRLALSFRARSVSFRSGLGNFRAICIALWMTLLGDGSRCNNTDRTGERANKQSALAVFPEDAASKESKRAKGWIGFV